MFIVCDGLPAWQLDWTGMFYSMVETFQWAVGAKVHIVVKQYN